VKKWLCLTLFLALAAVLTVPAAVDAASQVTQSASTRNFTAVSIKAQDYLSDVSGIVFPIGSPGETVSNPYNTVNSSSSPQAFGTGGAARPVVTLVNTDASHEYVIHYNITSWTNNVVASEYYVVKEKGADCAVDALNNQVVFDTNNNTSVIIAPSSGGDSSKKDLYLKVVLGNTGGLSGSSTISIISEAN
jgi:hypothetical protein